MPSLSTTRVARKALTPHDVLYLQRTIGNQATARILHRVPSASPKAEADPGARQSDTAPITPSTTAAASARHKPISSLPDSGAQRTPQKLPGIRRAPQGAPTVSRSAAGIIQRLAVDGTDWNTVTDAKAPGGGVTGVTFVHDGNNELVIKGLNEPPQRVMLAQDLMQRQGLRTANTRPVAPASPEGMQIIAKIEEVITRRNDPNTDKSALPYGPNVATNVLQKRLNKTIKKRARTILVMEKMDVIELDKLDKAQERNIDPSRALTNMEFWRKLGKQAAVDLFLGNEDRLQGLKLQNMFIDAFGELVAMDNDAVFFEPKLDYTTGKKDNKSTPVQVSRTKYLDVATGGGYMYEDANENLQERYAGSVELISGTDAEMTAKIGELAGQLVNMLAGGYKGKDFAGTLTAQRAAIVQAVVQGAKEARDDLRNMMYRRTGGRKPLLDEKFETYENRYKGDFGSDNLYNKTGFDIKSEYFKGREYGESPERVKSELGSRFHKEMVDKPGTRDKLAQFRQQLDALVPDDIKANDRANYDFMLAEWHKRINTSMGGYEHVKSSYTAAVADFAASRMRAIMAAAKGYAQRARVDLGNLPTGPTMVDESISQLTELMNRTTSKKSRLSKIRFQRRGEADRMIGQLYRVKNVATAVKRWSDTAIAAYD